MYSFTRLFTTPPIDVHTPSNKASRVERVDI